MKTRTAVWITIAIVIANSAITWFAIKAWLAIPGRHRPPNRWHIELGNLSEALAASASAGAALAALWAASVALRVADRDRRDRQQEREDEEKTHARLVRLSVETRLAVLDPSKKYDPSPILEVKVRNFGPLPVLDVEVSGADWPEHPTARVRASNLGRGGPILRSNRSDAPYEEMIHFAVELLHPDEERTLIKKAEVQRFPGGVPDYVFPDLSEVRINVRFTTANGVRWETPTQGVGSGEPVQVKSL
jgi:hypothetical protein